MNKYRISLNDTKAKDDDKEKCNKIAHWILEQNVNKGIKNADIREIGKLIFGLELSANDIKNIKNALEGLGYDRILDYKPYNSTQEKADAILEYYNDGGNAPNHVEYALTKLFGDKYDNVKYLVEINLIDLAKVYDYMKKSYQKEINSYPKNHEVPTKAFDIFGLIQRNIKDSKSILWGAKAYDIQKECWRGFCKYIDTESGKEASKILENEVPFPYSKYIFLGSYNKLPEYFIMLKDKKFKDSDSLVGKKISWDRRALYGVILSENDPLTNKTTIEETSTGKVYFVSTRLLNKAIDKGEAKLYDKKFKDSPDWETLKRSKDFVLRRLFKELEEEKAKPMSVDKENNIADIKSQIRKRAKEIKNVPNDIYDSLNDAKLTRKQKLWYGEELEKFIHPQYLRRNYQLKRLKRRKTK